MADGIGSHSAGDLASREAVQALMAVAERQEVTDAMLNTAVANARDRIDKIPVGDGKRRPGTTISGAIITYCDGVPCWMVVNLGDSRTYRLEATGLRQLTRDHSVGQKLVEAGVASHGAPAQISVGNILTRAVIGGTEHSPDVWRLPVKVGDRILVCSDGLSSVVDDPDIQRVLQTVRDPQAAVDVLIDSAIRSGGGDDVTAVVVDAVAIRPRHYSDMSTRAVRRGEFARDGATGRPPTDLNIVTTRARWRA